MSARWRLDLGAVFVYLGLGAMFSSVPRFVVEDLGGTRAWAGFAVSVFFLAAVVARPLAGRFIDRRGRRPLLVWLPFAIVAAVLGLLVAESLAAVLALRFVQGVAGGSFYVAAVTAETDLAPADRRASAVARLSVAIYLGFAVGPSLGELLADRSDALTWLVVAAVVAVGGALTATVPETRVAPPARAASPAGPAGTAGAPQPGPVEHAPLVHPRAVLPGLTLLTLGVGYTSITALSALYARSIDLASASELYDAFAGSILVVRLGAGRLADRVGAVRVVFPGLGSFVAGFVVLSQSTTLGPALAGVALVGTGWALVFPAVIAWLTGQVPDDQRGAALGTLVALMDVGQGTGGYLVGAVADGSGFGWAYLVPAALALAGAVAMAAAFARGRAVALAPR